MNAPERPQPLSAKDKMLELIRQRAALAAAKKFEAEIAQQVAVAHVPFSALAESEKCSVSPSPNSSSQVEITLNEQQLQAVQYATSGIEFCLIGAAGTGKTTTVRESIRQILAKFAAQTQDGIIPDGAVALVAFTRRAVKNIAKAVRSIGADKYCQTAHSLLNYQPNRDGYLGADGEWKTSMRFEPTITKMAPDRKVKLIVIDEASMLGYTTLYRELREGFPEAKFIFIGDLNQLPPVFGDAVLGFKLAELPVVELTQVYRQAMDSPIVAFQHNFTLRGKIPTESELKRITESSTPDKGLEFIAFKQDHHDAEQMAEGVAHYMMRQLEAGLYDPTLDTILIPYNKAFGSIAINLHIAEYLAKKNKLEVYEIIANYEKKYFAISDFVMHEKRECVITNITRNKKYLGTSPQLSSVDLSRYGYIRIGGKIPALHLDEVGDMSAIDAETILSMASSEGDDAKTLASSHIIHLRDCDTGQEFEIGTVGEVKGLDFGYCMTIHKSQGSEWRKVWLILHRKLHATMLSRELLYTGMTRAKEKLTVIYSGPTATGRKDSSISKCITKAVIPGIGWKDKVTVFQGKKQHSGAGGGWHG